MNAIKAPFFAIGMVAGSVLWFLFNILSYVLVCVYAIGLRIVTLSKWENMNGDAYGWWPKCLKLNEYHCILPYHFMALGMYIVAIFNLELAIWMTFRLFLGLTAWEFLGILLNYLHKWTEEADRPLWSSVHYDGPYNSDWSFR